MIAMCSQRHSILFFVSGIFFIISGKYEFNHSVISIVFHYLANQPIYKCKYLLNLFCVCVCVTIAGLTMLIGIIMYISLFKSEVGSKLRPLSVFQPPLFTYKYGHSFILYVIGCVSAELVGTFNIFLFIRIREMGRDKVLHYFFSVSNNFSL